MIDEHNSIRINPNDIDAIIDATRELRDDKEQR